MEEKHTITILTEQFGGSLWEKHGHRRIYFEGANIAQQQGLDWASYNTGNISSATLNGDKISNSECRRILDGFRWFKIWYDLNRNEFCTRGSGSDVEISYPVCQKMFAQFVADATDAIGG